MNGDVALAQSAFAAVAMFCGALSRYQALCANAHKLHLEVVEARSDKARRTNSLAA